MAQIIITGHKNSNYQSIEQCLLPKYIAKPYKSKNENLTPQEINQILLKATTLLSSPAAQISPSRIWDGLIANLLIANLNQPSWGWADSSLLPLLQYWYNIDDSSKILLVYSEPHSVLLQHLNTINLEESKQKIQSWVNYNQSMLDFHLKNKERSILIYNNYAQPLCTESLQQIINKLNIPSRQHGAVSLLNDTKNANRDNQEDNLPYFLADFVIQRVPAARRLYAKLEEHAFLSSKQKQNQLNTTQAVEIAWNTLVSQKKHNQLAIEHKNQEIERKNTENALLTNQLSIIKDKLANESKKIILLNKEKQALLQENQKNLQNLFNISEQKNAYEKENMLLLEQLHLTQEKMEKLYIENQQLSSRPTYYGAAERVKQDINYRLGAVMINKSKQPLGWISMPFALIAESKKFNKHKTELSNLPPVQFYNDAIEAKRFQNHLSYKLGTTLLNNIKNPFSWPTLPWKLYNTFKTFKKENSK